VTIADAGSPGGVEERASAQQDQDAPLEQAEAERRQVTALSCVLVGLAAMANKFFVFACSPVVGGEECRRDQLDNRDGVFEGLYRAF
jgi:hypothetical protein